MSAYRGMQGKVDVEVHLADESVAPDSDFCIRVFGAIAGGVHVERGTVRITSPVLPCPQAPDNSDGYRYSRHKVRRWLRTLLGGMLVPFHEASPVREVVITDLSP